MTLQLRFLVFEKIFKPGYGIDIGTIYHAGIYLSGFHVPMSAKF